MDLMCKNTQQTTYIYCRERKNIHINILYNLWNFIYKFGIIYDSLEESIIYKRKGKVFVQQ
jgi:hypothetical protein